MEVARPREFFQESMGPVLMKHAKARLAGSSRQEGNGSTTLTSQVYGQLRSEIIGCQLKPNEKLRLVVLQQRLGVSMSAIREALSRLAAEGLVVAEDQRGFRVSPVSKEDLVDLTRVRIQIELLALAESLRSGDIAWEASLLGAYHQMSRSAPPTRGSSDADDPGAQFHRKFHDALVAACGSHWLQYFREIVYSESERYRRLAILPSVRKHRDIAAEHKELLESALARDVERASKAIELHFSRTANLAIQAQGLSSVAVVGNGPQPKSAKAKSAARK